MNKIKSSFLIVKGSLDKWCCGLICIVEEETRKNDGLSHINDIHHCRNKLVVGETKRNRLRT